VVLHTDYQAPGTSLSDNYESVFSNPMYRQLRDRNPAFAGTIARAGARVSFSYKGNTDSAAAEIVSGNFFAVLGVPAAIGRVFTPADDGAPGANPVIVLGHGFWSNRFAKSPEILNKTVTINGRPMVVIGVAAARFNGILPGSTPDIYVPLAMKQSVTPTWDGLKDSRMRWLSVFARLKPGWSLPRAQSATDSVYRAVLESELASVGRMRTERAREEFLSHRAQLLPAAQGINGLRRDWEKPLVALMAMVGVVLLIACANVASLMLARANARRREIAIRLAMGASRRALVRQLLIEGLGLALAGGVLGLLVASWCAEALIRLLPGNYAGNWLTAAVDYRVLGFNLALALASGLAFALVPALQATRPDLAETLKNQASSVASGGASARFRKVLVTAQVALSLLLLVGAGLFSTSLVRLMHVDLGFRAERLTMFSIDATTTRPTLSEAVEFYKALQERLAQSAEVAGVGAAAGGPFSGSSRGGNLTVEGYQPKEDESVGSSRVAIGPAYFRALGVPLRAGREFTDRDHSAAPKVVVVNETFVKRYLAGRDPVGRRLMFGASSKPVLDREIVGVVADLRTDVRNPAKEALYFPYSQWDRPEHLTVYVRARGGEERIGTAIREAVRSLDPNLPVRDMKPVTVQIQESIYADRLIAILSVAFGALATLLAAIGLYGVVAYAVARRTPEIGVRMALGAVPAHVLRLVMLEAGRTAVAGIAIGLVCAFVLGRYVETQLFGVKASNPAVFAAAAALLAAVALLSAFVPGRRATRINPVSALKYE
jgi:predicted permease